MLQCVSLIFCIPVSCIQESKRELQDIQNAIHDKLSKRAILREEKVGPSQPKDAYNPIT